MAYGKYASVAKIINKRAEKFEVLTWFIKGCLKYLDFSLILINRFMISDIYEFIKCAFWPLFF